MKVSIITVTHNAEKTLQSAVDSIREQTYLDIEYIVVDGKSEDSTIEVIQDNPDIVDHWVSEEDRGMYDAMNKGIDMASGEIIAFLNADDFYARPDSVESMAKLMKEKNVVSCYADLVYVSKANNEKVLRKWKSGQYRDGLFMKGWMPPHPTFFARKKVYDKYGVFNRSLGTAADYEIMLRFLHKHKISVAYLPETIVKMRAGGVSNASLMNRLRANMNDRKAWKINGLRPKPYTLVLKPLRKLTQLLRR